MDKPPKPYNVNKLLDIDELRTGDLIFIRYSLNPLSIAIRFFINMFKKKGEYDCPYNHIAMIVKDWGVPMVLEARGRGVMETPAEYRLLKKKICIKRLRKVVDEKRFAINATMHEGKKYGLFNLLVRQPIFQITRIWIKGGEKNPYCSNLFAKIMYGYSDGAKYPDWLEKDPQDLWNDADYITCFEGRVCEII